MPDKPLATGTSHTLPFERLSPRDFERLCLWLIELDGYEAIEWLGATGADGGRDVVARRGESRVAFQCKRVTRFGPADAELAIDKILRLPAEKKPDKLILVLSCEATDETRTRAKRRCSPIECELWTGSKLDLAVKRHADVLEEFFQLTFPRGLQQLPPIGALVRSGRQLSPPTLRGLRVDPTNPLQLDFLVDLGDADERAARQEVEHLISYFLAGLCVPDENMWVNLSPYESKRIIPDDFGATILGHHMLAQDYILKQYAASVLYPESPVGSAYWGKVYEQAFGAHGREDECAVETFNKIWIIPGSASILERSDRAIIVDSHLRVLLEEDYLATTGHLREETPEGSSEGTFRNRATIGSRVFKEVVLPEVEYEVNEGKRFANTRQMYHSLILASWYRGKLEKSVLKEAYTGKTSDVENESLEFKEFLYDKYLKSFKKGTFDYIREDADSTGELLPRKYFCGGILASRIHQVWNVRRGVPQTGQDLGDLQVLLAKAEFVPTGKRKRKSSGPLSWLARAPRALLRSLKKVGGIDMNLQRHLEMKVAREGEGFEFRLDAEVLRKLSEANGFTSKVLSAKLVSVAEAMGDQ